MYVRKPHSGGIVVAKNHESTSKPDSQAEFERGQQDGYEHKDWTYEHSVQTGAGLAPDVPHEKDNDDYNNGVEQGREDREDDGK